MALRRLVTETSLGRPQNRCDYMENEMQFFKKNQEEVDEYLANRHETIEINAEYCAEIVKHNVMSRLSVVPYVMGFKSNYR